MVRRVVVCEVWDVETSSTGSHASSNESLLMISRMSSGVGSSTFGRERYLGMAMVPSGASYGRSIVVWQ